MSFLFGDLMTKKGAFQQPLRSGNAFDVSLARQLKVVPKPLTPGTSLCRILKLSGPISVALFLRGQLGGRFMFLGEEANLRSKTADGTKVFGLFSDVLHLTGWHQSSMELSEHWKSG